MRDFTELRWSEKTALERFFTPLLYAAFFLIAAFGAAGIMYVLSSWPAFDHSERAVTNGLEIERGK